MSYHQGVPMSQRHKDKNIHFIGASKYKLLYIVYRMNIDDFYFFKCITAYSLVSLENEELSNK